jgi:hypothetical protein
MKWYVIGCSVRGASHERAEKPNQDAIKFERNYGSDSLALLAVADGHGGNRYVRSAVGAKIAVDVAIGVLHDYLLRPEQPEVIDGYPNLKVRRQLALEWLPVEITRRWRSLVKKHMASNPWTEAERCLILAAGDETDDETGPFRSYGTTLVAVMITQDFVLYVQIGDGDILAVSNDGIVDRPIADKTEQIGDVTDSLASMDPWNDFRVAIVPTATHSPQLIIACTDGYRKSFAEDEGFERVASDLVEQIKLLGIEAVETSLPVWLAETSAEGSGDDISVGIAWALDKSTVATESEHRS